jgi:hypothetical protein
MTNNFDLLQQLMTKNFSMNENAIDLFDRDFTGAQQKWKALSADHRIEVNLALDCDPNHFVRIEEHTEYQLHLRVETDVFYDQCWLEIKGYGGGRGSKGCSLERQVLISLDAAPIDTAGFIDKLMPNQRHHRLRSFIRETYDQFLALFVPERSEIHELTGYDS